MKKLIAFIKDHPLLSRALHTFWQSFTATFIVGLTPILTSATNGNFDLAKTSLIALFIASISAGASAIKTILVTKETEKL